MIQNIKHWLSSSHNNCAFKCIFARGIIHVVTSINLT